MSDSTHDRYCENVNSEPWTSVCGCKERWQDAEIQRLKELDRIGRENHDRLMAENAALKTALKGLII